MDVFNAARKVGPTGKAIGVDMTDNMLELARKNAVQGGYTNVEFVSYSNSILVDPLTKAQRSNLTSRQWCSQMALLTLSARTV